MLGRLDEGLVATIVRRFQESVMAPALHPERLSIAALEKGRRIRTALGCKATGQILATMARLAPSPLLAYAPVARSPPLRVAMPSHNAHRVSTLCSACAATKGSEERTLGQASADERRGSNANLNPNTKNQQGVARASLCTRVGHAGDNGSRPSGCCAWHGYCLPGGTHVAEIPS